MGGSGGSGSFDFPGGSSSRGVREHSKGDGGGADGLCQKISEQLRVQSPRPSILEQLKVGDVLTVSDSDGGPPIVVIAPAGKLGSLMPSSGHQLLECIGAGYSYAATIISIKEGICVVRIEAE